MAICDPENFQMILAYLHTGILVTSKYSTTSFFIQICKLAEYFCLTNLINICERQLSLRITPSNYIDLLAFSIEQKLEYLRERCSMFQLRLLMTNNTSRLVLLNEDQLEKLDKVGKGLYNELFFDLVHLNKRFNAKLVPQDTNNK